MSASLAARLVLRGAWIAQTPDSAWQPVVLRSLTASSSELGSEGWESGREPCTGPLPGQR